MKRFFFLLLVAITLNLNSIKAQDVIEIEPLFEYPVAPEELQTLSDKCDYIVKNFWNNFNFKNKQPVDQYALNNAFQVYSSAIPYALSKEVNTSVDKLIEKISGNPSLLIQFTKAAEENLYGPRAEIWVDDVYMKFLEAIIKNKKISDTRKKKYIDQASSISESRVGEKAPSFNFKDREDQDKKYFPMSTPTIIIIGNPNNTDWRLARLRLDTNFKLSDALDKGKINILYMVPSNIKDWKEDVSNYNNRWIIGQSEDVNKHFDSRMDPAIYLIDSDGKILNKNAMLDHAVSTILELVN